MIIDISSFQGGNVNFAKLKNAVEGVIIRCGWGSDYTEQDDPEFKQNVEGCIAYGVPFGVYLYSYAKTLSQAESEAKHVMRLCDPYKDKMTFPAFYDLEENGTQSGAVDRARKWASILQAAGYKVGMYANSNWWKNYLKGLDEYPKWVANYGNNDGKPHTKPSNTNMILWQYTSRGSVPGIKGNVDCNLYYGYTIIKPGENTEDKKEDNKEVYEMPTIKKGSIGKAVKIWQIIIGVAADGIFGAQTETATKKFQKKYNLVIDGIVGKNTWKAGLDSVK